jgi:hypothetical protein
MLCCAVRLQIRLQSYCSALAALAAIGFAGAAYAGDATAPKAMTDEQMDKVTGRQRA